MKPEFRQSDDKSLHDYLQWEHEEGHFRIDYAKHIQYSDIADHQNHLAPKVPGPESDSNVHHYTLYDRNHQVVDLHSAPN